MAKISCKLYQVIIDLGDSDLEGILGDAEVVKLSDCTRLSRNGELSGMVGCLKKETHSVQPMQLTTRGLRV